MSQGLPSCEEFQAAEGREQVASKVGKRAKIEEGEGGIYRNT